MKLKVFFVSESHFLKDGGGFYAAENARQACQLFINESSEENTHWDGTVQEMLETFHDGQPRRLDLKFA